MRALIAAVLLLLAVPAAASAAPVALLPSEVEVAENAGAAVIEVSLSEPADEPVDVSWRTGTAARYIADAPEAAGGAAYTPAAGTAHFAPGQTRAQMTVAVIDDAVDDSSSYFAVELPGGEEGRARAYTLVQILDDEPTPPASVADVRVREDAGAVLVPLTRPAVSLRGHAGYAWSVRSGSALRDRDFAGPEGRSTIGYGETASAARVRILNDRRPEGDERFEIRIVPDDGPYPSFGGFFPGPVAGETATVTIVDDEPAPVARVTRLRGTVRLAGRRLGEPAAAARGARLDARRGAARLEFGARGTATVAGGTVRLGRRGVATLTSRHLAVRATRGVRLDGRTVRILAASGTARWRLGETAAGTLVRVRDGRVRAGGATLRAGAERLFRDP